MLESCVTYSVLPASDLRRATEWYRDKLELEPERTTEGGVLYGTGSASKIYVYETANAGSAQNTAMCWLVPDIEATMPHLRERGVEFADYIRPIDVPGSKLAFRLRGQQLRYLTVTPKRSETIKTIDLIKGPDRTAPVVMAVTVETGG